MSWGKGVELTAFSKVSFQPYGSTKDSCETSSPETLGGIGLRRVIVSVLEPWVEMLGLCDKCTKVGGSHSNLTSHGEVKSWLQSKSMANAPTDFAGAKISPSQSNLRSENAMPDKSSTGTNDSGLAILLE